MLIFLIILVLRNTVLVATATSGKSPIVRQADGFYRCPKDPITLKYPDPEDKYCLHYYMCHLSHAFPMKCPLRKVFHPTIGECIPRTEVPEEVCPFEIKCGFNGYYPDPKDCTRYYICFYHQPSHFSCSDAYTFNPRKNLCEKNPAKALECSRPKPLPQFTPPPPIKPTSARTVTTQPSAATTLHATSTKSTIQKRSDPAPELTPEEEYREQSIFIL